MSFHFKLSVRNTYFSIITYDTLDKAHFEFDPGSFTVSHSVFKVQTSKIENLAIVPIK